MTTTSSSTSSTSSASTPGKGRSRPFVHTDYVIVMLMSAMRRFPDVLDTVRHLGPELFPDGACRTLASSIVLGTPPDIQPLGRTQRDQLHDLTIEVNECGLPHDTVWAFKLVQAQAERRYQFLLAETLRWTAERVDEGARLDYLHRLLNKAFDIAEGNAPFDPAGGWGVGDGR